MKHFSYIGLLLLMVSAYSSSTKARSINSFDDINTGQMVVQIGDQTSQLLPLMDTQITLEVHGLVARARVKQFFENPSDTVIEATYLFPLPEDSAVDYMKMVIGDRQILGEIKERQLARTIYQKARKAGKKTALMEQSRANLFRTRVANILPGEVIEVTLEYQQVVSYHQGELSLRIPTTLTPRYQPKLMQPMIENFVDRGGAWDARLDASVMAPVVDKHFASDHQLSIDIQLNAGLEIIAIESPYHGLRKSKKSLGKYQLTLTDEARADRDFELRWRLRPSAMPRLVSFHEAHPEEPDYLYTQLLLIPPSNEQFTPLSRDISFIIDQSGSMEGQSMLQAKLALSRAINQLSDQDDFNIIAFNHKVTRLFPAPTPVQQSSRSLAEDFVMTLDADGGTEMYPALEAALSEPSAGKDIRQIVFLTDGAISNEAQLFKLINDQLGEARLFTLGIGSAPNSYFMRKAAQLGRGGFTYIGKVTEVSHKMDKLFEQLRYPAMGDIRAEWSDPVEYYPRKLPDLYQGQPLSLIVKRPVKETQVTFNGIRGQTAWHADVSLAASPMQQSKGIAALWARAKIADLMDQQIEAGPDDRIRDSVLQLALKHRLMSPYTSFVAVEQKISRPENSGLQQGAIANLKPAGGQIFAYPSTAIGWQRQLILAFSLLLMVLWLKRLGNQRNV